MIRIDLHSHSYSSPDGGIMIDEYKSVIRDKRLNYIAVTDHDTIAGAYVVKKAVGEAIIIGEEITTNQGELIGLFLSSAIKPGLSALETAKAIKTQGGLVYVPHPFETVRKGITKEALDSISEYVDIVETFNGRAFFQNKGPEALKWARIHGKATASSSDAHGHKGLASSYTVINEKPTAKNLVNQLKTAKYSTKRPPLYTLLYPKLNRVRGKLRPNK